MPDFGVSGTACNNSTLTFTNTTDESNHGSALSYEWVFADEGSSTAKDTVFNFATAGDRLVRLRSSVPGCTSSYTDSTITLISGPSVDFSYLNNCFGEDINFTGTIGGVFNSQVWDFGDGGNQSGLNNPTHRYSAAGTYTVSYTVGNADGCFSVSSQNITVNDQPLLDFSFTSGVQNTPISFTGQDLTLSSDSILSWSWDFASLGSSNLQSPSFSFSSPGSYQVNLQSTTAQGCGSSVSKSVTVTEPICPTVNFTVDTPVICIDEAVIVSNTSINAISYEWDFCAGDLESGSPTASSHFSNNLLNFSFDLELVEDNGLWYGFVPSRTDEKLLRLDFGTDLSSTPTITDLGNVGGLFNDPNGVAITKEGSLWYGLVVNFVDGVMTRLSFGDSLSNTPSGVLVSNSNLIPGNADVSLEFDGDSLFAFVTGSSSSGGEIVRHRYGSSILNTPTVDTFNLPSVAATDIQLIRECDQWYGLATSFDNSRVFKLSFGSSLSHDPVIDEIVVGGITFTSPTKVSLVNDGGDYYGFIQLRGGNIIKLSYGSSMSNTPTGLDLGDLGGVLTANSFGFAMGKSNSKWEGYTIDFSSNTLYRLDFANGCAGSSFVSTSVTPSGINYGTSGSKKISLKGTDSNGHISYHSQNVTVNTSVAPSISFSIDASRCILNSNVFTPSNTGLSSYSWDFSGEGSSSLASPTYQFPTTGDKTITLTVSDGTCSNNYSETITIYPRPVEPSFSFPNSSYCSDTDFQLLNNTGDAAFNNNLIYTWTIPESGQTFDGKDPTFNINTSGNIMIQGQTTVPGCQSNVVTKSLEIKSSPKTDFSPSFTCFEEVTSFTNNTDDAISYNWIFGDGVSSAQVSPQHKYSEAGKYVVSLSSTNTGGCTSIKTDTLIIHSLPKAGFEVAIPCEGSVALRDTSSVLNADIAEWQWFVADELLSTNQDPGLAINDPGTYEVTATVKSTAGCESSISKSIVVLDGAEVDFALETSCDDEPLSFGDISEESAVNPIISRSWDINGTIYSDSSFTHSFGSYGRFPVSLTVTTSNLCTATTQDTITVDAPPELGFVVGDLCQNALTVLTDTTISPADSILNRTWYINDVLVGNGPLLAHKFSNSGFNDVRLVLETLDNCTYDIESEIDVPQAAISSFEVNTGFGIPGTQVTFQNLSEKSESFSWKIDGEEVSTDENLGRVFTEPGTYKVDLFAFSPDQCADTASIEILIREPEVDLIVEEIQLLEQDSLFSSVVVSLRNESNLPVDNLRFTIQVEDQLPTRNIISEFVDIGERKVIQLEAGVPNAAEYLCVSVSAIYDALDLNPGDNEICLNDEPQAIFEPPFPNPARDETTVRTILPVDGDLTISLLNLSGKAEYSETYKDLEAGLHSFRVEIGPYDPGLYLMKIEYQGNVEIIRILKQ